MQQQNEHNMGWNGYGQQDALMGGQNMGMGNPGMGNPNMGGNMNPTPSEDQNMNYYQEYCKLFVANVVLTNQIKELIAEKNELMAKVVRLEKDDYTSNTRQMTQEEFQDKKKRSRRTASEIERHYECPAENCQKSYGSEGALLQHVRLKHPDMAEEVKAKFSSME